MQLCNKFESTFHTPDSAKNYFQDQESTEEPGSEGGHTLSLKFIKSSGHAWEGENNIFQK